MQYRARSALVTCAVILAALCPTHMALAQQTNQPPPAQFEPLVPPTIDPDALKAPAPAEEIARPKAEQTEDTQPKLKAPSVKLGDYDLQFKAGQTSDVNPRTGFDSGETSNISKIRPGKSESVAPNYFGLKLTAPTHK